MINFIRKNFLSVVPFFIYIFPVLVFIAFLIDHLLFSGDMTLWVAFLLSLPCSAVTGILASLILLIFIRNKTRFTKILLWISLVAGLIELTAGALGISLLIMVLK